MRLLLRVSLGVVLAAILSACSSVPLTSLPKLRGLKAETVDMSQLELAIRLQDNMGIAKDGAVLGMIIQNTESGERLSKQMILQDPNPELTPYLRRQQKPGYRVYRFKLTGEQLAAAQAFRQQALDFQARTSEDKTKGTFDASARFCSHAEGTAFEQATMTFYVRILRPHQIRQRVFQAL